MHNIAQYGNNMRTWKLWFWYLLKGPSRYFFFVAPMPFVSLEMVRDAFLAPRLSQKVPQKQNFGVKRFRDPTTRGGTLPN